MQTQPTYAQKMRQANREAKSTVVALVLTVAVWALLGFGLAPTGIEIFHTPVWVIGGTVGTWLFAIGVAVFLSRRVIADVDLGDDEAVVGVPTWGAGEREAGRGAAATRIEAGDDHE